MKNAKIIFCLIITFSLIISVTSNTFAKNNPEGYLYGEPIITKIEVPVYPEKSDDWDIVQNLALGVQPQILMYKEPTEQADYDYNTREDYSMLTDGVYASSFNVHNGTYFNTYRTGTERTIIFDIGYLSAVNEIKVSFLQKTDWGIQIPDVIYITLSENGYDWYDFGKINLTGENNSHIIKGKIFNSPVICRFVSLRYKNTLAYASCDEIEINGTKNTHFSTQLSKLGIRSYRMFRNEIVTPSSKILCGTENMLLTYHSRQFDWTENYFAPYVAHIDKDGNADDVFFDGYCFCMSGVFPNSYVHGYLETNMKDWAWSLDKVFGSNINLQALNSAAGNAKKQIGLDNYKYKFFVDIYYPHPNQTNFGDVDGDGISEDFSVTENRIKAVKWYIDEFYSKLTQTDYENVEFGGFYWYNESISTDPETKKMMIEISDYIHSKGSQFFWMPYIQANGHYCYDAFGFDCAYLQPNYFFDTTVSDSYLYRAINQAEKFGLGIDYEFDNRILTDTETYLPRFLQYLKLISQTNVSAAVKSYYQGVNSLFECYKSDNPIMRMIYDYTYYYSNNNLVLTPQSINSSEKCEINASISGTLPTQSVDLPAEFTVISQPKHGKVEVNRDGTYTYTPDENYQGSDEFTYTYNNYLCESDTCTVTVDIEPRIVIGDVNFDGFCDGMDAVIVNCIANEMLTDKQVSDAVRVAADFNRDRIIDRFDVDTINRVGMFILVNKSIQNL